MQIIKIFFLIIVISIIHSLLNRQSKDLHYEIRNEINLKNYAIKSKSREISLKSHGQNPARFPLAYTCPYIRIGQVQVNKCERSR